MRGMLIGWEKSKNAAKMMTEGLFLVGRDDERDFSSHTYVQDPRQPRGADFASKVNLAELRSKCGALTGPSGVVSD